MTEEERIEYRRKYTDWKKTQKEFYPQLFEFKTKETTLIGYVGNFPIKIGDKFGGATVLRIEAYQQQLDTAYEGLGCAITFDRMPSFCLLEEAPLDL